MKYCSPFHPSNGKAGKGKAYSTKYTCFFTHIQISKIEIKKYSSQKRFKDNKDTPSHWKRHDKKQYVERVKDGRLLIAKQRITGHRIRIPERKLCLFYCRDCQLPPRILLTHRIGN